MSECCANCIFYEFVKKNEFHYGKESGKAGHYCNYYEKWMDSAGGKCSQYTDNGD